MTHPQDTTSEVVARLNALIADEAADHAGHAADAVEQGERPDLWDREIAVPVDLACALETQLAALTKRVGELEGALKEARDALVAAEVRDDNARFRANSPRQDAEVKHLRASAIVRARRLTGGEADGKPS